MTEQPSGRPRSVMTPEKEIEILTSVKLGLRPATAARIAGLAASTFQSHMQRNEEFRARVEAAEATSDRNALAAIVEKFRKDWKAAAWFLERRFPGEYAKREVVIDEAPDKARAMREFFQKALRETEGSGEAE